jgi:hypothetical protein
VRIGLIVVAAAATAATLLYVLGWPASLYRHNDFVTFWVGSRMLLDGVDPYDPARFLEMHRQIGSQGLAINPPGIGFGYPLTTAVVFVPFALVPVALAAPLWLVTQATLGLGALVMLARQLFPASQRRDLPVLLALGASSQPAWLLAFGGNLGGYLLAIAAGGTALLLAGRPFAAGLIAGMLVIKPHPLLIALPLLLLALPRRDAGRVIGGAALTAGAVFAASLALRPGWVQEFLVPFGAIGGAATPRSTAFGLLGPSLGGAVWLVVAAIVAGYVVWLVRRPRPLALAVALAIPISLFCIPYGWSYDQLPLLVSAAVIVAIAARAGPRTRVLLIAALALVLVLMTWVLYAIAFTRENESLSALTPVAIAALAAVAARVVPGWSESAGAVMWHDARGDGRAAEGA